MVPYLWIIVLVVGLRSHAAGAAERCHTVPIHQCTIEVPGGAWVVVEFDDKKEKIAALSKVEGFGIYGQDWTKLRAKQRALMNCAESFGNDRYLAMRELVVGATWAAVEDRLPNGHYEECKKFIANNPQALQCEKGTFVHCED